MGYKREAKHYRLTFTGDMAGFEAVMRRLSSEEFLTLTGIASDGVTIETGKTMFAHLGKALVSWNLEDDDGNPVPADEGSFLALDWELVTKLLGAYLDAAAGVAPPLPPGSNGGGRHLEASIPMAPLSPSHSS